MDFSTYISQISFRAIGPEASVRPDGRLAISRASVEDAGLLELPGSPVDFLNVALPEGEPDTRARLEPTRVIPRMSTLAIGAVIDRAVTDMPADQAFVNVGVWHGFTFFSGALGNPRKHCVGIDNFSQFAQRDVRSPLLERLDRLASPRHEFREMDYREYFATVHDDPIGVYLYDGHHDYEHQLEGLRAAAPFFADGCVIVVDDTNWAAPYRATRDFVAASDRRWEVICDLTTEDNAHPTWWNGLLVLKDVTNARSASPPAFREAGDGKETPRPAFVPTPLGPDPAAVSIVVRNTGPAPALRDTLESALSQTWPGVEVVVAGDHPGAECEAVLRSFGDRIRVAPPTGQADTLRPAIDLTRGELIAFADGTTRLRPTAVEIGMTFPRPSRFNRTLDDEQIRGLEQALAA